MFKPIYRKKTSLKKITLEEDKYHSLHISRFKIEFLGNHFEIKINYPKNTIIGITCNGLSLFTEEDDLRFFDQGEFTFDFFC